MLAFNWGMFWALLAAFAVKGAVSRLLKSDTEILRTPIGFVIRK